MPDNNDISLHSPSLFFYIHLPGVSVDCNHPKKIRVCLCQWLTALPSNIWSDSLFGLYPGNIHNPSAKDDEHDHDHVLGGHDVPLLLDLDIPRITTHHCNFNHSDKQLVLDRSREWPGDQGRVNGHDQVQHLGRGGQLGRCLHPWSNVPHHIIVSYR